ncbi:MAG: hypothetical protein HKN47_20755 [Pirellulaceae bacterium]|nr:hypothetical protein [Pirellulaceae bacterium]
MFGEFFDPEVEFSIREHCRPHWSQAGAVVFITFRTRDSIAREVLQRWERERQDWLARRGINPSGLHWSKIIPLLQPSTQHEFKTTFNRQRETFLDQCHGACVLERPELAQIVAKSLMHFDSDRYHMGDFVIMPNHVHLLCAFTTVEALSKQCYSWMHYTAYRIHQSIGEKGDFWQEEPFDHLVRSPEQYDYLRDYIAENPKKAKLKPGQYLHRRLP